MEYLNYEKQPKIIINRNSIQQNNIYHFLLAPHSLNQRFQSSQDKKRTVHIVLVTAVWKLYLKAKHQTEISVFPVLTYVLGNQDPTSPCNFNFFNN